MANKNKSISRSKLISKIASRAGISKTAAKEACKCIIGNSKIHRKQKVKEVPTTKEIVVKVASKPLVKSINVKKAMPVVKKETRIKKVNVIQEKIVEKPIEIIKEIEVIKEVPVVVEKEVIRKVEVIKEVPVKVYKSINQVKEVVNNTSKRKLVNKIKTLEEQIASAKRKSKKSKSKIKKLNKKIAKMQSKASSIANVREVEKIKSLDMKRLKSMIKELKTVQVSKKVIGETRLVKEGRIVSRREIKNNGTLVKRR